MKRFGRRVRGAHVPLGTKCTPRKKRYPGGEMYINVSISLNSHDRIKQGKVTYGKIPGIWNVQKQHVLYMKEFLAKDSYFRFQIQFLGFVKMTKSRSKTDEVP